MSLSTLPYELKLMISSYLDNFELLCFIMTNKRLILQHRDLIKRKSAKKYIYKRFFFEKGVERIKFLKMKVTHSISNNPHILTLIRLLPGAAGSNDLEFINKALAHPQLKGRGVSKALMVSLINDYLGTADLLYPYLRSKKSLCYHYYLKELIRLHAYHGTLSWWHDKFGSKYDARLIIYAFENNNDEAVKFLYEHGAKWLPNRSILIRKLIERGKDAWDIIDYLTPYAQKDSYTWNNELVNLLEKGKFATVERIMKIVELKIIEVHSQDKKVRIWLRMKK